jgi:carbohydrate binding protein with CBM4/9 domain
MKKMMWLGLLITATCLAQDDELISKMINRETNGTWYFQPDKPKAKHFAVPDLPGGYAFRVKAHKGVNPWDVQANSPVAGAINEGDVVMISYYARAAEPAEGGSKLTVRIQQNSPPWTSVLETATPITGEWKNYCAFRVATASIGEKKSNVSIHLATAQQVIELGPVLVFNFGKDYDQKKLSFCGG